MKRGPDIYIFIIICILTIFIPGCELLRPPDVITSVVSDIGPTSATGGGKVTNDGNSAMIARGVCWSTKKSPDIEDQRTTDGYEIGEYISNITGLDPKYFISCQSVRIKRRRHFLWQGSDIHHKPIWYS